MLPVLSISPSQVFHSMSSLETGQRKEEKIGQKEEEKTGQRKEGKTGRREEEKTRQRKEEKTDKMKKQTIFQRKEGLVIPRLSDTIEGVSKHSFDALSDKIYGSATRSVSSESLSSSKYSLSKSSSISKRSESFTSEYSVADLKPESEGKAGSDQKMYTRSFTKSSMKYHRIDSTGDVKHKPPVTKSKHRDMQGERGHTDFLRTSKIKMEDKIRRGSADTRKLSSARQTLTHSQVFAEKTQAKRIKGARGGVDTGKDFDSKKKDGVSKTPSELSLSSVSLDEESEDDSQWSEGSDEDIKDKGRKQESLEKKVKTRTLSEKEKILVSRKVEKKPHKQEIKLPSKRSSIEGASFLNDQSSDRTLSGAIDTKKSREIKASEREKSFKTEEQTPSIQLSSVKGGFGSGKIHTDSSKIIGKTPSEKKFKEKVLIEEGNLAKYAQKLTTKSLTDENRDEDLLKSFKKPVLKKQVDSSRKIVPSDASAYSDESGPESFTDSEERLEDYEKGSEDSDEIEHLAEKRATYKSRHIRQRKTLTTALDTGGEKFQLSKTSEGSEEKAKQKRGIQVKKKRKVEEEKNKMAGGESEWTEEDSIREDRYEAIKGSSDTEIDTDVSEDKVKRRSRVKGIDSVGRSWMKGKDFDRREPVEPKSFITESKQKGSSRKDKGQYKKEKGIKRTDKIKEEDEESLQSLEQSEYYDDENRQDISLRKRRDQYKQIGESSEATVSGSTESKIEKGIRHADKTKEEDEESMQSFEQSEYYDDENRQDISLKKRANKYKQRGESRIATASRKKENKIEKGIRHADKSKEEDEESIQSFEQSEYYDDENRQDIAPKKRADKFKQRGESRVATASRRKERKIEQHDGYLGSYEDEKDGDRHKIESEPDYKEQIEDIGKKISPEERGRRMSKYEDKDRRDEDKKYEQARGTRHSFTVEDERQLQSRGKDRDTEYDDEFRPEDGRTKSDTTHRQERKTRYEEKLTDEKTAPSPSKKKDKDFEREDGHTRPHRDRARRSSYSEDIDNQYEEETRGEHRRRSLVKSADSKDSMGEGSRYETARGVRGTDKPEDERQLQQMSKGRSTRRDDEFSSGFGHKYEPERERDNRSLDDDDLQSLEDRESEDRQRRARQRTREPRIGDKGVTSEYEAIIDAESDRSSVRKKLERRLEKEQMKEYEKAKEREDRSGTNSKLSTPDGSQSFERGKSLEAIALRPKRSDSRKISRPYKKSLKVSIMPGTWYFLKDPGVMVCHHPLLGELRSPKRIQSKADSEYDFQSLLRFDCAAKTVFEP